MEQMEQMLHLQNCKKKEKKEKVEQKEIIKKKEAGEIRTRAHTPAKRNQ